MSQIIQKPTGTLDIFPSDIWRWHTIEKIARQVAEIYDFREIRTPMFESADLFHRGVGETTDIVTKETYTFSIRGNPPLTLRPEGTAGVVRAMIENSKLADQGSRAKVYYIAPNFRYERPQDGRYHQHTQFGVEAFGVADPEQDAECILLHMDLYRRVGLKDLELKLNSLGDRESKQRYRDALVAYFTPMAGSMSEESQRRLQTNPLRILDSKDPKDTAACAGAPPADASLSEMSRSHFQKVQDLLASAGIKFRADPTLVRGFDYYTGTVWEVTAAGLGAQSAVGGGGRYDNLVETLGGRPTPGVGFGVGLERLLIALDRQNIPVPDGRRPLVWVAVQGDVWSAAWGVLAKLRAAGISSDMAVGGKKMKDQMKIAERQGAKYCVVLGESEVAAGTAGLKNMQTREQQTLPVADVIAALLAM